MICSRCTNAAKRKGFFNRTTGRKLKIQRYYCDTCRRSFSDQTGSYDQGERKTHVNQPLFRLLCSGVSQRRSARILGVHHVTVARKLVRMGTKSRYDRVRKISYPEITCVMFDEMETFEHTKYKPLAITVAVDGETRRIISARVAQMASKGRLAKGSRKKYGYRADRRRNALNFTMRQVKKSCPNLKLLISDRCPRYPVVTRKYFPGVPHGTTKGRRGCIVGQGELKRGGFDPLFPLNHTCAMLRDNLKRLTRKTWCTTKDPKRLQDLVDLYASYHNQVIADESPYLRI